MKDFKKEEDLGIYSQVRLGAYQWTTLPDELLSHFEDFAGEGLSTRQAMKKAKNLGLINKYTVYPDKGGELLLSSWYLKKAYGTYKQNYFKAQRQKNK